MNIDQRARDESVIQQFRANAGRVEGFEDGTVILVTTIGAKSGRPRTTPLRYTRYGEHHVIIASHQGAPKSPDWYHNLVANPDVTVEVGDEKFEARARIAGGEERDRLYAAHAARLPQFADYQKRTSRVIPVVVLERKV